MKRKLLTAVLSLAVAFALWIYVIMVISPNSEGTYNNIPVTLTGERVLLERGLIVTSYTPTVSLRLAGNRTDLGKLSSSNISINVNVSQIYDRGEVALSYSVGYPGDVPSSAITIQNRSPGQVTLQVENYISKMVDVKVNYLGTLPEGLMYDKENVELDHPQIRVSGPQSVVDKIAQARIEVDLSDRSESFMDRFIYTLCDSEGQPVDAEVIETDVDSVNLTLQIRRVKEIPLRVDVIPGGGANENNSEISLSMDTIRISGSGMLLDGIDELVVGTVNLGEVLGASEITFPINLPEGVTNETGVGEVKVSVRFPNLKIVRVSITNIRAIHVPEGLEAEIITGKLEVSVRGPAEMVGTIRESDITVTVDFANVQVGSQTLPAQITLSNRFSDMGVVGSYSVTATLREPPPPETGPTED